MKNRNKNKKKQTIGIITKEEIIKQTKVRSTDILMPKGGKWMTEKDRPRKKFKKTDYFE